MSDSGSGPRGRVSLITAAQPSYDDQFRRRRRRYVIMMGMRVPFLIAAALLYHIPWLAVLLIVVSIPLPWCAVLIANDGPARKPAKATRGTFNDQRALPGPPREVIDTADATPEADGTAGGPAAPGGSGTVPDSTVPVGAVPDGATPVPTPPA